MIIKKLPYGDVYRQIFYNVETSRNQIASELNLSLPTVTSRLQLLIADGYICIDGTLESTGGRKADMYKIVPTARYAVGIDVTAKHLNAVVIDLASNIVASRRIRINHEDSDEYYNMVSKTIDEMLKEAKVNRDLVLGVGISLPAIIKKDQKSISYLKVLDVSNNFYERLSEYIEFPYLAFNDANSAGLAEWWSTTSTKTAVYLALNPSVGGATINGKTIHLGDNNRASEFGHITIHPGGRRCYCGRKGCVDAYISENILSDFTDGNLEQFFQNMSTNVGYQKIFDAYLDSVALTVNTLRICYDSDVILGGNVGSYIGDYLDILKEKAVKLNPFEENANYISACTYKNNASAVGAALHYIKKFVEEME